MKTCPACNEKIKDDALRCKHCGTDLPVRRCPWCAEIIDEHAKKCKHCKSYVDKIRCGDCGTHVEVADMSCATCVHDHIEHGLVERWANERFKMKIKNWILIGVTIFALIFGIIKSI